MITERQTKYIGWGIQIITIICLIGAFYFSRLSMSNFDGFLNREIQPMDLRGVIVNRYYDKKDHNLLKIQINNKGEFFELIYFRDFDSFWDTIEINDSLIKPSNTMEFLIIKKDQKFTFKYFAHSKSKWFN
jgi:hypothetical protein